MQSLLHPVAPIDWRQHFDIGAEAQASAFELETLARLLVAALAGAFAEPVSRSNQSIDWWFIAGVAQSLWQCRLAGLLADWRA